MPGDRTADVRAEDIKEVAIDGDTLTIPEVVAVARYMAKVTVSKKVLDKVRTNRKVVDAIIKEGKVSYGINTGFGDLCKVVISPEEVAHLQQNIILSHAAATGHPHHRETVRAILLLRANGLAKGMSGVRPVLIETLVEMLNKGVHPLIPEKGSLGASGDLAPLAHMALVMLGEGEAFVKGERLLGGTAMERAGIKTLTLEAKEGLALINGTQVMTAMAALALYDSRRLLKVADVAGIMSLEGLKGTDRHFDERIHMARPHTGQLAVAENMRMLTVDSAIVASHRDCPKVQDAYTLRCMPQVHGATRDAIDYVSKIVTTELNAATDNPLVFTKECESISGGNFHGQPVAIAMDFLCIAIAELANISERRIERLLNHNISNLPPFLTDKGGLNSGLMIAQYTAASLVSENKILAHPASVDSIPVSASQEDHVSMGTTAARKAVQVVENVTHVLATEVLCAAQALDYYVPEILPGKGILSGHAAVRELVPHLDHDRLLIQDVRTVKALVVSGRLVEAVEGAIGPLL